MKKDTVKLVRLLDVDTDFIIELPYATTNNFTNQVIYDANECFINPETAELLIKAKNKFKEDGYRVKVWDAYRPIQAQKKFYEITGESDFVATPPDMETIQEFTASHLNGMSVDITLTDKNGKNLLMPTEFDSFSEKATANCKDNVGEALENVLYMIGVMESVGFENYEKEWWHFCDRKTTPTTYLDFALSELIK